MDIAVPREFDIALFFERLLVLLNDPANRNLLLWNPDGKRFLIRNDQRFQVELCPLFFQLCSWSNFLQTLYACGFRRTRTKLEFHHPVFNRRRLETITMTQRQELFRSELGVKPRTPNTKNNMQTWEEWLGPEIQCHPENPAPPKPGPSNPSPNKENQPKPRCRKNSNPLKIEDNLIFGVDKVTSESSSDELPMSTSTSNRDTTSEGSNPKTPNAAINEEDTTGDANSFNPVASNDHTYSIDPEREPEISDRSTKESANPVVLNEENTEVDVEAISTEESNESSSSSTTDEPEATQNPHQALNDEPSSSSDQVSSSNASTGSWTTNTTDSDNSPSNGDQASNDGSPSNDQESSPGSSNSGDEDQSSDPEESLSSSEGMYDANIRGLARGNSPEIDKDSSPKHEPVMVRIPRKYLSGAYRKD